MPEERLGAPRALPLQRRLRTMGDMQVEELVGAEFASAVRQTPGPWLGGSDLEASVLASIRGSVNAPQGRLGASCVLPLRRQALMMADLQAEALVHAEFANAVRKKAGASTNRVELGAPVLASIRASLHGMAIASKRSSSEAPWGSGR